MAVQISQATVPAVVPTESSAIDCATELALLEQSAVNELVDQAQQHVNDRQTEAAAIALTQAFEAIGQVEDVSSKVTLLDQIINSYEGSADRSLLEQLVNQANPPQRQQVAAVLPQAAQVTQSLSSGYSATKTRTLTSIARYYGILEQPQQTQTVLAQALQASQSIRGAEFQTKALTDIAQIYVAIHQLQAAVPILAQSLQFAQVATYPDANRRAWSLEPIARLYAQLGEPDRALQVARQIEDAPYYQSIAMIAVIDEYLKAGQLNQGGQLNQVRLLDRAVSIALDIPADDQRAIILGAIAGRYAEARQPDRAAELLGQALEISARTRTTSEREQAAVAVIVRYAAVWQIDDALRVHALRLLGDFDDPTAKATGYGAIALLYAEIGQTERAQATLTQAVQNIAAIADLSSRNLVRRQLIDQAVQSERYDLALQVVQTVSLAEETEEAFTGYDRAQDIIQLANQAIAANRYDDALKITQAIPPNYVEWRDRLFLQIARGFAEAGDFDRAQAMAQQNVDPGFQAQVFAVVAAQIQLVAQQVDSATELFNQSVQLANTVDSAAVKAEVLRAIATERFRANQPEAATQLLNQAVELVKTIEDEESRLSTLQAISAQFSAANQHQAAIQVTDAILDAPVRRAAAIADAIAAAIEGGDISTALATLNRLDDPATKTTLLLKIADRYTQLGQRSQAASSLAQAFQIAQTIPGEESQTVNVRGGENPLTVEDEQDRGSLLAAIALKYAQIGQEQQSLQVAQALQDPAGRDALMLRLRCYGATPAQ
ncbi:hypothetical protein [Phormidium sp. FACHB-77]|uniref:hypothetical protein n=1 Tax=Cyanophyceae TaxID=3028117 RepID=UPI00168915CC|nr:hypothetical protein [Phormidium sp. FACHB-77]MBD1918085.1 hypothetical protein [Phormidium sp. FACHB-77]